MLTVAHRLNTVVFYDQVIRESKRLERPIHLGRLFDICVLKVSELEEGHVNRKWKGRVVFGGNNVQDEYGMAAAFPEAGSGASYASASELLDTVSMFPGNVGEQSDAPAAYTQAEMYEEDIEHHNTPTYVQLPEWQLEPDDEYMLGDPEDYYFIDEQGNLIELALIVPEAGNAGGLLGGGKPGAARRARGDLSSW